MQYKEARKFRSLEFPIDSVYIAQQNKLEGAKTNMQSSRQFLPQILTSKNKICENLEKFHLS
jgi:hypothetical protein